MYKKKVNLLIIGMIFLFTMMFVSAVPPFQESNDQIGLRIESANPTSHPLNTNYYLHAHIYNATNGLLINSGLTCNYHFYNHQIEGNEHIQTGFMTQYGAGYNATINGSLINQSGEYSALIWCNSTDAGGFFKYTLDASESGVNITESRANLTIGLLAILVFLLFISLYALFNVENYIGKFVLYWLSHVLMILISFVGWQVGVEGLLGGMALTGIFRIMFWVFTIAVLPMIILSGAWIFYIHAFNEHFEKLIDKGMDTENAFKMANKKSGGWFNGK